MKKLTQILLVVLFLLQGTNIANGFILALFLFLFGYLIVEKRGKVKLPSYYVLALIVYSFYLGIGLINFHENLFIDIKFQLFSFLFFFWLINEDSKIDFLKLLFTINTITVVIYILLYINVIPNLWNESTFGFKGRLYGSAITPIILILFYYLLFEKTFDKKLIYATIMGTIYISLTTNFMNLAILIILLLLITVNFKKLMNPVYIIGLLIISLSGIWYLNSPFVPELVVEKMKYISNPLEYPSLKIRAEDFNKIIANENFGIFKQFFGEGYGTSSQIYRHNPVAVSLSRTFNFQEIDNGFYYLYHRGGWTLLSIFICSHLYLMLRIKSFKAKVGFLTLVFITNILSIHYFNYYFYLLIPFFILYQNKTYIKYNR